MRNHRFRELLSELITTHPDVTGVAEVDQGVHGRVMRVSFGDGSEIDLLVVNSSPPGGDHGPERVVSKHDLAQR